MKKIFGLVALLITGAWAATSALYLHHERSSQATVEADCQNREVCLDKVNLAPIGRFNDGTLWHGVTQEKPNVNLTGTLTVTGATVLSNNLTLSLIPTGCIPYTTTAGLITSGTGLAYNGSAFSVTGTGAISSNATVGGTLVVTGVISGSSTLMTTGVAGIGTSTADPTAGLHIGAGGATPTQGSGTSQYGLVINPIAGSDASSAFYADYTLARANGSITNLYGKYIETSNKQSGTTANNYGLFIANQTVGTNNWAIKTGTGLVDFGQNVTVAGTLGVTGVTTATGGLTLGASFVDKTTSLTSNTTLTSAHSTIFASASGGSFTLTLPAAAGNTGLTYTIYKTDVSAAATGGGNTVTIDGNASETIGGDLTQVLASNTGNGTIRIICDGSNWSIQELTDEGTFTATIATGLTTTPTGTSNYSRSRKIVVIDFPTITGTSNSISMSITGMPNSIRPVTNAQSVYVHLIDDNNNTPGHLNVRTSSSTLDALPIGTAATLATLGNFTNTGTKGIFSTNITYSIK